MKLRVLFTAAALIVTSQAANAVVGDAGCGLGSMIIQDNTKLMQIFAVTSNGFTGSQLFGITSGTSNCRAQNFVMREKAVQYFAEVNKEDLSREMAQGRGEKLNTIASLYGCDQSAQPAFAKMTQGSYERIIPASTTTVTEMVSNLSRELKSNSDLAKSCQAI
jgi:hypothetical protein